MDISYQFIDARPSLGEGDFDIRWSLPQRIGDNIPVKEIALFERDYLSPEWREIDRYKVPIDRVTLTDRLPDRKYYYGVADVYGDNIGRITSIPEPISIYRKPLDFDTESYRLQPLDRSINDYYIEPSPYTIPHTIPMDIPYQFIDARPSLRAGDIDIRWSLPQRIGDNIPVKEIALFERDYLSPEWREIDRYKVPIDRVTLTERLPDRKYYYGVADVYGDNIGRITSIPEPISCFRKPLDFDTESYRLQPLDRSINDYYIEPSSHRTPHIMPMDIPYQFIDARPSLRGDIDIRWSLPQRIGDIPVKEIALFERDYLSPEWREIDRYKVPIDRVTLSDRLPDRRYFYGVADVYGDNIGKITSIPEPISIYRKPLDFDTESYRLQSLDRPINDYYIEPSSHRLPYTMPMDIPYQFIDARPSLREGDIDIQWSLPQRIGDNIPVKEIALFERDYLSPVWREIDRYKVPIDRVTLSDRLPDCRYFYGVADVYGDNIGRITSIPEPISIYRKPLDFDTESYRLQSLDRPINDYYIEPSSHRIPYTIPMNIPYQFIDARPSLREGDFDIRWSLPQRIGDIPVKEIALFERDNLSPEWREIDRYKIPIDRVTLSDRLPDRRYVYGVADVFEDKIGSITSTPQPISIYRKPLDYEIEYSYRQVPLNKIIKDYYIEPSPYMSVDRPYHYIYARPSFKEGKIDILLSLPERLSDDTPVKEIALFEREHLSPDWREIGRYKLPINRITLTDRLPDFKYLYGVADVYGDKIGRIISTLEPVSSYSKPLLSEIIQPISLRLLQRDNYNYPEVIWDKPIHFEDNKDQYFIDMYIPKTKSWISVGEVMPGMSSFKLPEDVVYEKDTKVRILHKENDKYFPISHYMILEDIPNYSKNLSYYDVPQVRQHQYSTTDYIPKFTPDISLKNLSAIENFSDYHSPLIQLYPQSRKRYLPLYSDETTPSITNSLMYSFPDDYHNIPTLSQPYGFNKTLVSPAPIGPLQIIPIEDSKIQLRWEPYHYPSNKYKLPISYIIESRPIDSDYSWTFQSEVGPHSSMVTLPRPKTDSYFRIRSKLGDIFSAPLTESYYPRITTPHYAIDYDFPRLRADYTPNLNAIKLDLATLKHMDKENQIDYIVQVKSNDTSFWKTVAIIPKDIDHYTYHNIQPDIIYQFQVIPRLLKNDFSDIPIISNYVSIPSDILSLKPEIERKSTSLYKRSPIISNNQLYLDEWIPERYTWVPIRNEDIIKSNLKTPNYDAPRYFRVRNEDIPDRVDRYYVRSINEIKTKPLAPLVFTAHQEPSTKYVNFNIIPSVSSPSDGIPTSYIIEYRTSTDNNWKYLTETDVTNYHLVEKSLKPDAKYDFRIYSKNIYGQSTPIETCLIADYFPNVVLKRIPEDSIYIEPLDTDTYQIKWSALDSPQVSGYRVEKFEVDKDTQWKILDTIPSYQYFYRLIDLEPSSSYKFRITPIFDEHIGIPTIYNKPFRWERQMKFYPPSIEDVEFKRSPRGLVELSWKLEPIYLAKAQHDFIDYLIEIKMPDEYEWKNVGHVFNKNYFEIPDIFEKCIVPSHVRITPRIGGKYYESYVINFPHDVWISKEEVSNILPKYCTYSRISPSSLILKWDVFVPDYNPTASSYYVIEMKPENSFSWEPMGKVNSCLGYFNVNNLIPSIDYNFRICNYPNIKTTSTEYSYIFVPHYSTTDKIFSPTEPGDFIVQRKYDGVLLKWSSRDWVSGTKYVVEKIEKGNSSSIWEPLTTYPINDFQIFIPHLNDIFYDYRVIPVNIDGERGIPKYSDKIDVDYLSKSEKKIKPLWEIIRFDENDSVMKIGDNVSFTIYFEKDRDVIIQWLHNGVIIYPNIKYQITLEKDRSTLSIFNLSIFDQGLISCRIIDCFGFEIRQCKLFVEAIPRFLNRSPIPVNHTALTKRTFNLQIPIIYSLLPEIEIYKNDNLVIGNRIKCEIVNYMIYLTISDVRLEDFGYYKIKIFNRLGYDYYFFHLNVNGQPRTPTQPPIILESDYVIFLEWEYAYSDLITHYEIEYRLECGEWTRMGKSLSNRFVTNIFSDLFVNVGYYQFRYRAVNKFGISEPSPPSDDLIVETRRIIRENYPIGIDWTSKINKYDDFEKEYEILETISRIPDSTIYRVRNKNTGTLALSEVCDRRTVIENEAYLQSIRDSRNQNRDRFVEQSTVLSNFERPMVKVKERVTDDYLLSNKFEGLYSPQKLYKSTYCSAYIYPTISGESLYQPLVNKIRISERKTAEIIEQILKTLRDLHSEGIVHLGIEPRNIYYSPMNEKSVHLLPSPIMKMLPSQKEENTALNLNHMRYIPPEVLSKKPVSHATDLWSLGMMIYELYSLDDVSSKGQSKHVPDLNRMDGASAEMIDFTRKLLSTKPEDRPTVVTALEHPWIKSISKFEKKRSSIEYDMSLVKHEMESKEFTERFMHILRMKSNLASSKKQHRSLSIEDTENIILQPLPRRPKILTHLFDVFGVAGSKVILQCQYEVSRPDNSQVVWLCNNTEIKDRCSSKYFIDNSVNGYSSLEIRSLNTNSSGTYTLKVINEAGYAIESCNVLCKDSVSTRKRSIHQPSSLADEPMAPLIVLPLIDTICLSGNMVILTAKVSGIPKPSIVWKFNGKVFNPLTLDRYSLTEDNLSFELSIDRCNTSHSGLYTLEASNKYGFNSCSATLQIIDKLPDPCCIPPRFQMTLPSTTVVDGEEVEFQVCVAGMPLPDIRWLLNRREIPRQGLRLTFDDVTGICCCVMKTEVIDEDVITVGCEAKNIVGTAITETHIFRIDNLNSSKRRLVEDTSQKYSIKHTPEFVRVLRDQQARVGSTVSLFCSAIGKPIPDVYWLKDDSKIDIYHSKYTIKNYSGSAHLVINNMVSTDFGVYTAIALNSVGRVSTSCMVSEIKNIITDPPKLLRGINNITISEGRSVLFEVEVESDSSVTFKWEKDGCEINSINLRNTEISNLSPTISCLQMRRSTKSDEGLYRCTASNKYGHIQTSAFIWIDELTTVRRSVEKASFSSSKEITTISRSESLQQSNSEQDEEYLNIIESSPTTLEVVEGDEIILWCKVSGNSRIIAEWCKGIRTLVYDKRHRITQQNNIYEMAIAKSMLTDSGKYSLTLKSGSKVVTLTYRVDVSYKIKSSKYNSERLSSRESSYVSRDSTRSISRSKLP